MELLEICLRTMDFQVEDKFFQQKDSMASRLVSRFGLKRSNDVISQKIDHFLHIELRTSNPTEENIFQLCSLG
jgi:hypothetical protein